MRVSLFVAFIAFSAGCATGPNFSQMMPTQPEPAIGMTRIFLYRAHAVATYSADVYVDGNLAGSMPPRSFLFVDVEPGEHEISATGSFGDLHSEKFIAEEAEPLYIKLYSVMYFPILHLFIGYVQPVIPTHFDPKKEIKGLAYAGREANQ